MFENQIGAQSWRLSSHGSNMGLGLWLWVMSSAASRSVALLQLRAAPAHSAAERH